MPYESGHSKNVANFNQLIQICTGFGADYNPSNPALALTALNLLFTNADNSIKNIHTLMPPLTNAVNTRQAKFDSLSSLVTRIVNALASSDVPKEIIADAKTLARKIQGRRAGPKIADDPNTPEDESLNNISASQMSFDNRIANFDQLIKLVASQPGFSPNEADLKVAALQTFQTDLISFNSSVISVTVPVGNARISRNNLLYDKLAGIVAVALLIKKYISSLYGANSQQYKLVKGIKFTMVKI